MACMSRWEHKTLDVEGDADRFACEFLHEKFRRASHKRAAQGKNVRDDWNSGCDRLWLWVALSSYNALMDRWKEVRCFKVGKVQTADWTGGSVWVYAKQV